jgi:hypothetical protein
MDTEISKGGEVHDKYTLAYSTKWAKLWNSSVKQLASRVEVFSVLVYVAARIVRHPSVFFCLQPSSQCAGFFARNVFDFHL